MQTLDWNDAFDQFTYDAMQGFINRNYYWIDVQVDGKSQDELDKMVFRPPRTGQAHLHNEKVRLEAKAPDLKASDATEAVRLIKNFILAAKGYPDYWFGEGENRLTSSTAMAIPTMRMLKAKQRDVRQIIKFMAQYVVDQKLIYNKEAMKLSPNEYVDVSVSAYDFERRDSAIVASAFVQTVTALTVAMDKGIVTEEEGRDVAVNFLKGLGIEPETDKTVEQIRAEKAQRDEADIVSTMPDINEFLKGR